MGMQLGELQQPSTKRAFTYTQLSMKDNPDRLVRDHK